MLFLLCSAQRCQTLFSIETTDINFANDKVFIAPSGLLKQSRPGKHLETLVFQKYLKDKKLCIVNILSEYLSRTRDIRTNSKLLISTIKPFGPVSKSTISRWVKLVMNKAGIDMSFTPHSTRSAAVSKAKLQGIPLETIMKTAGWSNASVFATFYNKPVLKEPSFQDAILNA